MVMIIHFDGVIGEVYRRSLTDESSQLVLRHGAAEGLRELSKQFQLVLFSFLSEVSLGLAVDHLIRNEQIIFDGIYTRVQSLKRSEEYFNYNQVYADFDLLDTNNYNDDANSQLVE